MHRYGQIINLKPERVEEYKKLHAKVWTDVTKAIAKSNIKNYSIYLKDETLFSYFEYVGNSYEADMEEMAANPVVQKWWDICKPCMLPIETHEEGEWWANMEEIFHQD
ncbi:MAG: L-rhamnose mutarotase [Draconibacterium sp.]|nr:L-rhamnose mutarotase [Draconibacterium sp.]